MGTATRVLLIEADAQDQFLFAKLLVRGGLEPYEHRFVSSLAELDDSLREFAPDLVVTELNLRDSRGFDTIDRVLRRALPTPVIVLTRHDDLEMGRRAIELGAQDYVVKGELGPSALDRTLRHAIIRAAVHRASERAAFFDDLTGLPNRVLLRDRLAAALRRAARQSDHTAVLFIDLDGFKPVNDEFGHGVGDALLIAVGERLHRSLRASDTVARWGGDEFVCVLEGLASSERAMQVAANLHRVMLKPFDLSGRVGPSRLCIGASLGVALYPEHARDHESVLACADDAMYAAKRAGGGCVLWGSPGMRSLERPDESGVVRAARRGGGAISLERPKYEEPVRFGRLRG